ncbi:HNH endonuclease [Burkholderia cenocepacia]|uniref:HNH endonuclease signature motif containing protein n=2 Tax=Burkholderia cepacia complex TaxID=87882 RepID=UPI0028580170|nr:HNH endonuclease signature motif containing protein [Burkholderia cenocepacia]MDR8029511.1 HNH endonuclease [Burkholderia cenocepacia]MDR8042348.1 HNH endonuclease [Burkholderia cenocepacia]
METIDRIRRLTSLDDVKAMRKNAVENQRLTREIEVAFRDRELALRMDMLLEAIGRDSSSLQPVETEIAAGLAALWMTGNRPNYSIRGVVKRQSDLVSFARDTVAKRGKSEGYRRLMDAGFGHLVFERVVLNHPEVFSASILASARLRLDAAERGDNNEGVEDVSLADVDKTAGAVVLEPDGHFSTNSLLRALGFHKPTPHEWFARRGDEIVHLAWVEDADFQQSCALVFEQNVGDHRPTYTHWRRNVQRIMSGEYRAAYIVFGYRGQKGENLQLCSEVALYRMSNFTAIDGDVYASITLVHSPVEIGAQPLSTGTRETADTPPPRDYALAPIRPQQAAFRRAVFKRFDGRCALTGCKVAQLLDAAHLPGRDWSAGDNNAEDGILLRSDLHRALDGGLIRLDERLRLAWVAPALAPLYGHLLLGTESS